jgi:hypothetical protein
LRDSIWQFAKGSWQRAVGICKRQLAKGNLQKAVGKGQLAKKSCWRIVDIAKGNLQKVVGKDQNG